MISIVVRASEVKARIFSRSCWRARSSALRLARVSARLPPVSRWMESECARLDAARHAVAAGFTDKTRDELFRAAHDIKGEAATFGFPLIEPVAASLCRLIEHSPDVARIPLMLIDQHVDGIIAIVHRNARGNTERKARELARRLSQVTEESLLHENRHRPGYLDEADAPKIAP